MKKLILTSLLGLLAFCLTSRAADLAVAATDLRSAGWYDNEILEPYVEDHYLWLAWDYPGFEPALATYKYTIQQQTEGSTNWVDVVQTDYKDTGEEPIYIDGYEPYTVIGFRVKTQYQSNPPHYSEIVWIVYWIPE